MVGVSRRLVGVVLAAVLASTVMAATPTPARADGTFPIDRGTLTVCIQTGWYGSSCNMYAGNVELAPGSPGLISNTLTSYEKTFFFMPTFRFSGKVEALGTGGSTATLTVNVASAFGFLPLAMGNISFTDPGAGVSVNLGVWFSPSSSSTHRFYYVGHTGLPFFGRFLPGVISGFIAIA